MIEPTGDWAQTLAHLLALAERLEDHGQLSVAKLARASADSLARRAAYRLDLPQDPDALASDLGHLLAALPGYGLPQDLARAFQLGTDAITDGRLPLIHEIPNPYVCRTCGELSLTQPDTACAVCGAWPTTFRQVPPIYWLDEYEPMEALAALQATPALVAEFQDGLTDEQLGRAPAGGGWSMRQIIAHLRDAEGVLAFRARRLAEQDNPELESLAIFEWADSEEIKPPPTAEIFDSYRASRELTVAFLAGLPPNSWWRRGRHQEFGEVTLRQQASYFAAHEQIHLSGLAALRRELLND